MEKLDTIYVYGGIRLTLVHTIYYVLLGKFFHPLYPLLWLDQ